MTQEKVNSSIPSMVNYPEPATMEGISEIGFDETGARYKVTPTTKLEYALGWDTSGRSTSFPVNTPVVWNNFETNSESIKKSGSTYQGIILSPGKTYRLLGSFCVISSGTSEMRRRIRWFNVTKNQWIGCEGGGFSSESYENIGTGSAIAYVRPDEESVLELRCSYASGVDTYLQIPGASFEVQLFQNLEI